ncbi:hypothetical protein BJ508DRAFT_413357 [Ascobolus immersus RN42]|uniref:Peroxisomal membrane protein PEX14 n=1 Tax=Ascobolus immersus RN42 TaxID=1160509 RepID=A0A3N4IDR6_ASCIM|nr:hypothetical protein BJ508DRAFT_413357 [Ascobolus immersus RN42]
MREELIASAVTFLTDPQVASAPYEKRVAFLKAKNLTDQEIAAAFTRAGTPGSAVAPPPVPAYPPPAYGASPAYYPNAAARPGALETQQQRDWRDWFIMGTVTAGVSYGLYTLAKRYVVPLIAPPTPPQLEQDKAAIDASFAEAFAVLDQLKNDTTALKEAEVARSERLDKALEEVEAVVSGLKEAGKKREEENKRLAEEIRGLRGLIPKSLEGQKEAQTQSLTELQTELKSLKSLVMNRTGAARPAYFGGNTAPGAVPSIQGEAAASAPATPATPAGNVLGSGTPAPARSPLPFLGNKPTIPAWQLAAQNKAASEANGDASGTA